MDNLKFMDKLKLTSTKSWRWQRLMCYRLKIRSSIDWWKTNSLETTRGWNDGDGLDKHTGKWKSWAAPWNIFHCHPSSWQDQNQWAKKQKQGPHSKWSDARNGNSESMWMENAKKTSHLRPSKASHGKLIVSRQLTNFEHNCLMVAENIERNLWWIYGYVVFKEFSDMTPSGFRNKRGLGMLLGRRHLRWNKNAKSYGTWAFRKRT